ncbi:MAG: cytochrome b [Psychrobium sp.]
MNSQVTPLSKITISLHWIIAWTIIGLLALGIYMEENEAYQFYDLHKSIGALIFVVILVRVVWRIKQGWPTPASEYKKAEQLMSKLVHYALLIGSVIIPLSGLMMSWGGGHELAVFGVEVWGSNHDPVTDETVARSDAIGGLGHQLHGLVSNVVIGAIVLHVVGALKHHIIDKDATLKRMVGKS